MPFICKKCANFTDFVKNGAKTAKFIKIRGLLRFAIYNLCKTKIHLLQFM